MTHSLCDLFDGCSTVTLDMRWCAIYLQNGISRLFVLHIAEMILLNQSHHRIDNNTLPAMVYHHAAIFCGHATKLSCHCQLPSGWTHRRFAPDAQSGTDHPHAQSLRSARVGEVFVHDLMPAMDGGRMDGPKELDHVSREEFLRNPELDLVPSA